MGYFRRIMKPYKTYLFIAVLSVALLLVLGIQVNWLLTTARIKEELFNEKANLVLSKTAEALAADTSAGQNLRGKFDADGRRKADSLLTHYMAEYGIRLDYTFEMTPSASAGKPYAGFVSGTYLNPAGSYQTCIGDAPGQEALELKLSFPQKEQYIRAEMGTPFVASVVLLAVVLLLSWRTILSLLKEKRLSEHTTGFLNNMTHEFKTPLSNIALAGKMMRKEPNIGSEEKIRHYSGIILEENDKLRQQVEQVLGMTALERGELPLRKTDVNMHGLLPEVHHRMALQLENRQGNLSLELNAAHFWLKGDAVHLGNALCNLLDNAIKYSPQNPEIVVRTFNKDGYFRVSVADRGIGIDRRYRGKVFDAFYRVPTGDVHDVKGFGLGLAYVQKIAGLHGGTVELHSQKGNGTVITLILPYAER